MREEFLQYIWKCGLFGKQDMRTVTGEPIEVQALGVQNTNAGPDFLNARIKIGNVVWVGNVEIHNNASDWNKHNHSSDSAYNNVILHVVKNNDAAIETRNGTAMAVYELGYDTCFEQRYRQLMDEHKAQPCAHLLPQIESFRWRSFLTRLSFERLEQRTQHIADLLAMHKNDWDTVFMRLLFRAFGFGINAEPFEQLAQSITTACIAKHKNSLLQLEALLLGQAGFLGNPPIDEYQQRLQNEYQLLQAKFALKPLPQHIWKFLRTRPVNFPTVRIAQLAALLHSAQSLFARAMEVAAVEEALQLFAVRPSEYWDTHYSLEAVSPPRSKALGAKSAERVIANVLIPTMFQYGRSHNDESICQRAVSLLEQLPPEENATTLMWKGLCPSPQNMLESQALLQLKNEYCDKKRCLHCVVGGQIITGNQ
ncbi:hypothetical protein AGMMS4956_20540 [Bacteroidia bacterium]|nr:hypothetical protein AGMMS4956_20540 [Bacteroidia bacterium]